MASVASQLIEEATAHAQSDSLEDAREMCADGTYFPNKLLASVFKAFYPNSIPSVVPALAGTDCSHIQ